MGRPDENPEAEPINQPQENLSNVPPPAYSDISSAPLMPQQPAIPQQPVIPQQPAVTQQPAYAPTSASAPTMPIIQQPRVVVNPRFTNQPTFCTCPHCNYEGITKIEQSNGILTWVGCCCCICFGGWCGCCLIPFCIQGLKNTTHKCNRCGKFIHLHKPL